jgi:trk system potassium uptake protein
MPDKGGKTREARFKRFVVVGLGNFGASAAEALHAAGHDVSALDVDERKVDRIAPLVTQAAMGDGTEVRILERLGARDADAAVVSTGHDITASVLTTLALRDCGVREIYTKVISQNHARVMEKLGVTESIFPERESAQRLARRIVSRVILNYVPLGPRFGAQELAVPSSWIGRSLRDLDLTREYRVAVIAVHDFLTDELQAIPDPEAPLKDSDTLLVAGHEDDLARVSRLT